LRTTATVTNVESRTVTVGSQNRPEDRIRHYTTFEYQVDGQTIVVVRTSEHTIDFAPQQRRSVGEQFEIYYDGQNPHNFVSVNDADINIGSPINIVIVVGLVATIIFFIFILFRMKKPTVS